MKFFSDILGDNDYFGGEYLTLADIVAGTDISLLPKLGFDFNNYPKVNDWFERLMQRDVWQNTELTTEEFEQFKRVLMIIRQRKMRKD